MNCEACNDLGYLCMAVTSRSEGSLSEIQRCDACCKYRSDSDAIEAVYDKAVMYDNLEKIGEYASRRLAKLEDAAKEAVAALCEAGACLAGEKHIPRTRVRMALAASALEVALQ